MLATKNMGVSFHCPEIFTGHFFGTVVSPRLMFSSFLQRSRWWIAEIDKESNQIAESNDA